MEWILILAVSVVLLIGVPRLVGRAGKRTQLLLSILGAVLFCALAIGFYDPEKKYVIVVIAVVMAASIVTRYRAWRAGNSINQDARRV